jgi:hypothetical protein
MFCINLELNIFSYNFSFSFGSGEGCCYDLTQSRNELHMRDDTPNLPRKLCCYVSRVFNYILSVFFGSRKDNKLKLSL